MGTNRHSLATKLSLGRVGLGLGITLPLGFLVIFFLWPLFQIIFLGVAPDDSANFAAVWEVLTRPRTIRVIWQTGVQAALGTMLALVAGLPLAYLLYRFSFPGVRVIRALVMVPFVLPTVVVGVAFRSLFQENGWLGFLGWDESLYAVVTALAFFNVSVVVRTVGSSWQQLDLRLEQVAATLGASPKRVFWDVTFPRLRPAILSALSVVFLFCATSFGVVLTMGGLKYGTIETEIYFQTMDFLDLPAAATLSILQLATVGLVLYLINLARQRLNIQQLQPVVFEHTRPLQKRQLALLGFSFLVLLALALPMVALLFSSLSTAKGFGVDNYLNLLDLKGLGIQANLGQALFNSIYTALLAAVLAVSLALIAALTISRLSKTQKTASLVYDALLMAPLGVSAVTVGLGYLLTLNQSPLDLRTSPLLIPLAQALIAIPMVIRILLPVLQSIDDRMRLSAASLGASPFRIVFDIDLRIVAKPIAAATGFAFAVSLGEFGAAMLLTRPENPTMPVLIYKLLTRPGLDSFRTAMAAAIVLALLTTLVMILVERIQKGVAGVF